MPPVLLIADMIFDKEIFHKPDLNLDGLCACRKAVRAVILRDGKLLMIYSMKNDEYKFPGGGLESGESPEEALIREVREETGAVVKRIGEKIGKVKEYNRKEGDFADFFMMVSDYYDVEIESELGDQMLDDYERELEFVPVWIGTDDAERVNRSTMERGGARHTKWIERETFVLGELGRILRRSGNDGHRLESR